ncbi:ArdC-like ssDNA-binding domain-containing protein [Bradyrhizobium barranii]|uniref:ArdC-like ssDNA-binding domain-containing protein n=1 Tax=Bradyrhizobium barranii TaxID=2992140 RepID=UPI003D15F3D0
MRISWRASLTSGPHHPDVFRPVTANPRSSTLAWLRLHAHPGNEERRMIADAHQNITDQIIQMFEQGVKPWRQPYRSAFACSTPASERST